MQLSVITGNPLADAAHPSGMNGIMVKVAIKEKHEPRAPRIPNSLFQKPNNSRPSNIHSATPRKPQRGLALLWTVHHLTFFYSASDSGPLSAKLVKGAVLKTYKGFPHGMPTTNADQINSDLLEFIKS